MAKKVALYGSLTALALIFSYVERLIPIPLGIPGIKLGLANLVVLIALYTLRVPEALLISVTRIVLSGLLFGNLYSVLYSISGGLLSFAVMAWMSRRGRIRIVGVSVAGAIAHNAGQLAAAVAVTQTVSLLYYGPVLLLSGMVTGLLIGVVARLLLHRVRKLMNLIPEMAAREKTERPGS